MNQDPQPQGERRSIIDAYCVEFDRIATTLCDLLDVASRQGELHDSKDWQPLRAMGPSLDRLQAHLGRAVSGGDESSSRRAEDGPGFEDMLASFDAAQIDEICRPAVEASVAEILDAGQDSGQAEAGFGLGGGEYLRLSANMEPPTESTESTETGDATVGSSRDGDRSDEVEPESTVTRQAIDAPWEASISEPVPSIDPAPQSAVAQHIDSPETWESRSGLAPVPVSQLTNVLLQDLGGRVTLQGSAESLPISALFELLAGSRSTGCLHLRTPQEHLRFQFASGQVVATNTDNPPPGQRLGEIIHRLQLIDEQQLRPYVAEAARAGTPLGSVLVIAELLSVRDLTLALQTQVHARFNRVLKDEHVAYAFVPGQVDEADGRLRVETRQLLFESARRKDDHKQIKPTQTRVGARRGPARG